MYMTFLYLTFKMTKKTFFVKNQVCWENVLFSNKGENTKENIINLLDGFIYALILPSSVPAPALLD